MKREHALALWILLAVALSTASLSKAYAFPFSERPFLELENPVHIYLTSTQSLGFQHDDFVVYFNCITGVFNATIKELLLYSASGRIDFTCETSCVVAVISNNANVEVSRNNVRINGDPRAFSHQGYVVRWALQSVGLGFDMLPVGMGIAGIVAMVVCPIYTFKQVKERDVHGIGIGLAFTVVGFGLFVGWLMS